MLKLRGDRQHNGALKRLMVDVMLTESRTKHYLLVFLTTSAGHPMTRPCSEDERV